MKPVELFEKVVSVSPRFGDTMEEHLKDNDELLPHLLMSDLLRYVGGKLTACESRNRIEVQDILAVLETAFTSGNSETENAIAVSFLENLETEPFYAALAPLLGPGLRAEHKRQMEWPHAR